MAGVAHTPHLERRPSGYFFRRRIPTPRWAIPNPDHGSSLCLSVRTDVLSEAKIRVARLTALTDAVFALRTERPVDHLSAENITLLKELARFEIAAHEALRATSEPRSEAAATFAAQTERTTQDMLPRALALGDRTPAAAPLRDVSKFLGAALDEASANWRTLAFEALRVLLDASFEREPREVGSYEEPTPIFRSVMASRSASPGTSRPVAASQRSAPALAIPAAAAPVAVTQPAPTNLATTTPQTATEVVAPLQSPVETGAAPTANADTVPASSATPQPAAGDASPVVAAKDDDTALRIKLRPPLLENIDLRDLSPKTRDVLATRPRGITLLEGIQLMKELKLAGYGDDFSREQTGEETAGKEMEIEQRQQGERGRKILGGVRRGCALRGGGPGRHPRCPEKASQPALSALEGHRQVRGEERLPDPRR